MRIELDYGIAQLKMARYPERNGRSDLYAASQQ